MLGYGEDVGDSFTVQFRLSALKDVLDKLRDLTEQLVREMTR